MASAAQAEAFVLEDDFLQALDSVTDLLPAKRSVQALRPQQQSRAWAAYATRLEALLELAHEQLATARAQRAVRYFVRKEPELELLARVRAEQLMSLRLLKLLARCETLETLADSGAAEVLDERSRRQLRRSDFNEALAEYQALRQAECDHMMRVSESTRAKPLRLPGYLRNGE